MGVDIAKARAFVAEKERRQQTALLRKLRRARSDFQKIVALIVEKYQPLRIYQWGSLLDEFSFSEISDIDIAMEGITSAETFFRIYGDAMDLTDFPVHVVQLEKIEPEFRELIVTQGKLIYERPR